MDVKDAVKSAKEYLSTVLADEKIFNLGLEEIEKEDYSGNWRVTLGFSRPWDRSQGALLGLGADQATSRVYRVLTVNDSDGSVLSVKLRENH